ncbi:MAG TPA: colanic acid biosynthesis glycosyltransferase WcaI [Cyanobacteria bacterium UBA11369]|nr:colanic acid biosynthesis glycosyltransferase WcaI [Cyanobacteria bacterium UBA11371]HBE30566.1 colanic acid biosynthesis glycosyltransferase WcaI [Cyanobacteria bacterium UBA11368]HBE50902.1 colanic acid biosynthesis glycosyltransferase WcaI [Cyanobacteria bacterium UBA11369]
MRILIYSYNYAPEPIGIAPLMTELAEGLAKRGHRVRVVTGMPNYPERRIYPGYRGKLWITEKSKNGVVVQRNWLWIRPKPNLVDRILLDGSFVLLSLVHAIKGKRPDVILLTSPPLPVSVPAAFLGWLHRCPVVLNLQDILPEAAVHTGLLTNKTMIRVFEGLEKFAYRTARKISVISDVFVENLVKKRVREDKIALIPNWVNVNFIRPLPKENNTFRIAHQLEGKFVVLYSGNIARTQGIETVIDAAVRLQHIPDIVFAIVGEGKALHELEKYRQEKGADNVRLLPFVPREELPEMLAAADVGLIVQKKNVIAFNMPSKTQVLLASGRPIVASVPPSGTAARAVKQSGGGLVVEPEDPEALAIAVKDLYADREKAEKFGQQGRRYAVEQYSFEQALDRYEALFTEVSTAPATMRNVVPN